MTRRLAAVALLAACGGAEAPTEPEVVELDQRGLVATVWVTPARVAPGEAFEVGYLIRNATRDTLRVVFDCTQPVRDVTARRAADGAPVDVDIVPTGCVVGPISELLDPGATQGIGFRGRAVIPAGASFATPLPRGRYVIEVTPSTTTVNGAPVPPVVLQHALVVE
jgi:hypothetical protein